MKTDVKRTLEILRAAGSKGIHSFELNRAVGTTRAAARINDLMRMGYVISNNGGRKERLGDAYGVRYTLIAEKKEEKWIYDNEKGTARLVT